VLPLGLSGLEIWGLEFNSEVSVLKKAPGTTKTKQGFMLFVVAF